MNESTSETPEPTRTELGLIERALRERWPIPPHARIQILKRMAQLVEPGALNDDGAPISNRTAISACKVILAADRLNLAQAHLDLLTDEPTTLVVRDVLEEAERREREFVPAARPAAAQASGADAPKHV